MTDMVTVKVVPSEHEAEIACALLRTAGIECTFREPPIAGDGLWGWREIIVSENDAGAARELLDVPPAG